MDIKELCKISHRVACSKGFWSNELGVDCDRNDGELLMLISSELGECLEYLRHSNPKSDKIPKFSGAEEELADCIIRICDMAEARGWDLEGAIEAKMKYNRGREKKHGKKF